MDDDRHVRTLSRRDALRLFGASSAAAVGAGVVAACSGRASGPGGPSPTPSPTPSGRDVGDFGARGDGRTDDTAAIQRALDAMKAGEALAFPAGKVFCHSAVLTVSVAGVSLVGTGTLRATEEEHSALKIEAPDVTVEGLTLQVANTTQRWSAPDQHKLFVGEVDGVVVRDVVVSGSAAAGVFFLGSSNFLLQRPQVSDTRADGIHMTYGARNGRVDHPVVTRSGDDGVAVVSYAQDGRDCHDIEVTSPVVHATTWGRGISVVGGHDIRYDDVTIESSSAASVYIGCEPDPSDTSPTERVTVTGGSISGANTNHDIDHGAVLVYSGRAGGWVRDVTVSGLTVTGTRSGASRQIGVVSDGADDGVADVRFEDLRLAASPTPYQGNAPAGTFSLHDVAAAGRAVAA